MKKHILLTTTALFLSAVAMKTNAEPSNSTTLHMSVDVVRPLKLNNEQYLDFGGILADEGGKTVIVKTDGTLDSESTATLITKGENWINQGIIRAEGIRSDLGLQLETVDEQTINDAFYVNLAHSVDLTSGETICGTVSEFDTHITIDNNDFLIHIGGTFTTKDLSQITHSTSCGGDTIVTLVVNDDFAD